MPDGEAWPSELLAALQKEKATTHFWRNAGGQRILVVDEYSADWVRGFFEVVFEESTAGLVAEGWEILADGLDETLFSQKFPAPMPAPSPSAETEAGCFLAKSNV